VLAKIHEARNILRQTRNAYSHRAVRLGTQARVDKSRERRDEGQGDRDRHALTWNKGSGKAPKTERDCTDRNQRAEPTYRAVKRLAPEQKSFGNAGGKEDWIFSCTGS